MSNKFKNSQDPNDHSLQKSGSESVGHMSDQIESRERSAPKKIIQIGASQMNTMPNELLESPWIFAESPILDDANFTSQWLLAALEVDRLLKECYRDPDFRSHTNRLQALHAVKFSTAAVTFILSCAQDGMMSFEVANSDWAASFSIMAGTGFYTPTGDRYQMTLPKVLNMTTIKTALLRLAATADLDDCANLHPEFLLTTMTEQGALECERKHSGASWWT